MNVHDAAADGFMTRFTQAIQRCAANIDRVIFFIEESNDGSPKLARRIEGLSLRRKRDHYDIGEGIEVEKYLLTKKAREPGLEVTDFVAHASGNQAYCVTEHA